jgi:telomerase reverse transcriptase
MSRIRHKRNRRAEQPNAADPITKEGGGRAKKPKRGDGVSNTSSAISHPLLSQLYPHVCTLRGYVLSKLPSASRLRRKKIASVGLASESPGKVVTDTEQAVARLLDTTVVAQFAHTEAPQDDRWKRWDTFSQKGDESYVTLSDGFTGASFSQTEVRLSR